jgi:hypothetical protein
MAAVGIKKFLILKISILWDMAYSIPYLVPTHL